MTAVVRSATVGLISTRGLADHRPMKKRRKTVLTPREEEVAGLLATGIGTRVIAKKLSVSQFTVGTHVQNMLRKLELHSRLELVVHVLRKGLP